MSKQELTKRVLEIIENSGEPIARQAIASKFDAKDEVDEFQLRSVILELACQHKIKIRSDWKVEVQPTFHAQA